MSATKGVKIKLGGKDRFLRFTNRARRRLQDQTGLGLNEIMEKFKDGDDYYLSEVTWACLLHGEPDLELDAVVDWIELPRASEIGAAVGEALAVAYGPADPEKKAPAKGPSPAS